MSGACNLTHAVVNLLALREQGKAEMLKIISVASESKALIFDPKLTGSLSLICEVSVLKEQGVQKFHVLGPNLQSDLKNLIYIVRPRILNMKYISNHILSHLSASGSMQKNIYIYFVPRETRLCIDMLENYKVKKYITEIGALPIDLIPFDDELLSMENETAYKEIFLDGDNTTLHHLSRSLMKLQNMFGVIRNIKTIGNGAKTVKDMLLRMRKENRKEDEEALDKIVEPEIDTLILLDRQVDMITPMLTQIHYEGMIDEIIGINNTYVELEDDSTGGPTPTAGGAARKKVKYVLNSNDKIYRDVRDVHFEAVGMELNSKTKELSNFEKKRFDLQTVSQIRDFMKELPTNQISKQALARHVNIATMLKEIRIKPVFQQQLMMEQSILREDEFDFFNENLEELINKKEQLFKVLRLLILQSVIGNGLKAKQYDFFKREILQTYGYNMMFVLNNLEKLGLLKKQETKPSYPVLKKSLQLITDVDVKNPKDITYLYSGYAPLSLRLIQCAMRSNFKELMKTLAIPASEEVQNLPPGTNPNAPKKKNVVLVVYIGGVTLSEVAGVRFLNKQSEGQKDIIVATTKLINGTSLLRDAIFDDIDWPLLEAEGRIKK